VAGIFFAPAWILFEDRKLHPYLTDRSINDLQIPVKNNTSDEAGVAEVAGVQELQNGRDSRGESQYRSLKELNGAGQGQPGQEFEKPGGLGPLADLDS